MSRSDIIAGPSRLHHLDSLRGIAALAVALQHSMACFVSGRIHDYSYALFGLSPVVFFFLLSGFVLSRSLDVEKGRTFLGVLGYYIRRVFRLYPAALVAMGLAALIAFFTISDTNWIKLCTLFAWVDRFPERRHVGAEGIFSILTFQQIYVFNPPMWTIREEFACSFLLPLLILLMVRFPSMVLTMGAALAWMLWRARYHQPASFLFAFYLGYVIHMTSPHVEKISENTTKTVLFFALMLWIFSIKQGFNAVTGSIVLGVILLVLIPCQWPFLRRMLESTPLRFLGRISYSFYLLHFPIMLLTCGLLASRHLQFLNVSNRFVSSLILFVISVSITLVIGHLSERLVETPWNRFGRELSSRLLLVSK